MKTNQVNFNRMENNERCATGVKTNFNGIENKLKCNIAVKTIRIRLVILSLATLFGLAACNGGGSTTSAAGSMTQSSAVVDHVEVATDAQTRTPASAYINASSDGGNGLSSAKIASGNNCFSLVATPNGKSYTTTQNSAAYYSTVTVSFGVQNICATPQAMSGLVLNVNGLMLNGQAAAINYIGQGQNNPYLTLSSTTSGSNISLNLRTPACSGAYCSWAQVAAGGTSTFTVNAYVGAAINSLAVGGITISGNTPPPPPTPGNLAVNVNTTALAPICTAAAQCKIVVNVLDPTGAVIQTINVNPSVTPNYTVVYSNLLIGNYTMAVNTSSYPSGSGSAISYTYNPANGIAAVNSGTTTNASVNFQYTAPIQVGNLAIKTGNITEAATFANIGSLSGVATNIKTKINYPFSIGINGSTTLSNLPAGDTYSISLQGIADALSGVYYNVAVVSTTVAASTTTSISLAFSKVTSAQHSVVFTVTGAPSNQTIQLASTGSLFKYNVDSLSSGTYKFLTSEAAIAVTLVTPNGYTLVYTPTVITPSVSAFSATYSAITPPVSKALTTLNDQIIDANGNVIQLKGINWFGFNNSDMLNGMWNYDGLSGDFEVTVRRLKALGFNAVRLPFSFANLNAAIQNTYQYSSITPASTAQLISNLTNPSYSISGKTFPTLTHPSGETYANQYLPANSVMSRFIYVINFFAKNGFYVLVDNHTEDNSITGNQATWTANWKTLASNIVNGMPSSSSNMVMYDLRNEPDAIGYNWTQMGPLYLSTMDAINSVTNGNNLFFIEGSGQGGASANWGDGFVTNSSVISQKGLSDPNPFFKGLANKPYLNQVVLSPHVYPPSVTNAGSNFSGSGLYNRLSTSFGTLAKTGYCVAGVCHRFPIAIGEFGSNFVLANDLSFFISFANYMNNTNDALDGLHNPISNWFYWDYNPNSGDTGGIVANDWTSIQWIKVNYLSNGTISGTTTNSSGLGLSPWYR